MDWLMETLQLPPLRMPQTESEQLSFYGGLSVVVGVLLSIALYHINARVIHEHAAKAKQKQKTKTSSHNKDD